MQAGVYSMQSIELELLYYVALEPRAGATVLCNLQSCFYNMQSTELELLYYVIYRADEQYAVYRAELLYYVIHRAVYNMQSTELSYCIM
ncbi:hypothetical protein Hamer_G006595 [Homarus americanus]|uniref:Uncharacterized protein n=1 Tax=Homarus americanus TaxID=6706 RepID=A0A8J5JFC5_HOMAM|nr:hypothetical protein Hamer_G006595 [Homarus americanus]